VLVCELLDYIDENYSLSKEHFTTLHPLQSFSWKYFIDENAKASYGAKLGIEIPNNLISYSAEDKELAKLRFEDFKVDDFAANELQKIPEELYRIDLDDLCDFFTNPAKYFLQKCLQVNPKIWDLPELEDSENFALSGLERYQIAEKILKEQLNNNVDFESEQFKELMRKHFHANGMLPVKAWGDIEFTKFLDDFIPFARDIAEKIGKPQEALTKSHPFDNGVLVQARFNDLYLIESENQQIQFKYSNAKTNVKYWIRASLYDLAAKAMNVVSENSSFSLIAKDGLKSFAASDAKIAQQNLERLTELYLEGLRKPLPFFPNTSLAYIKTGENAAVKKWESSRNYTDNTTIPGEGDDAYVSCCFGKNFKTIDDFEKISKEILELLGLEEKK